jgi:anti-sigma factor RsiW
MTPICDTIRNSFSDYLDGAVNGHEMQAIAAHLDSCPACTDEFAGWRAMQQTLSTLRSTKAPEDLGLKLRLAISRERAARQATWRDSLSLAWDNMLRPFIVQAAGGLACAIALITTITFLLGVVPPPNAVLANDEPLGAMTTPHYLYSAVAPRPIILAGQAPDVSTTIVVEAMIGSNGRVYDYTVVSAPDGPDAPAIQAQVVDQLMLAVFRPASVFGVPVKGHVLMTFSGVSIHA